MTDRSDKSTPVRVTVHCPAGEITGVGDGEVNRFHSVPYSRIPGPFEDAVAREGGERIDATVHRPSDIALSIVSPAGARELSDLPVVVYIHGGRYEHGTHGDRRADGGPNAREGVVTVHLGYRVRLEGFARFHDDEPEHFRGIDDCQLGLEWVQRNIEAFGGDPTNVTLVGQSAGATTALWLSRRDHFRGAFRRVIAMSPCFPRAGWEKRRGAMRFFLGEPLTRASLTRLAESAPHRLDRAYRRFRSLHGTDMALGPSGFDGAELADLPLLLTSTRDEHYHNAVGAWVDRRGLGGAAVRLFARPMGLRGSVAGYLRAVRALDPRRPMGRLIGDSVNRRWVAQAAEQAPGPVWMAEFTADRGPALHCDEISPLFGLRGPSPVRDLFLGFVRGNPPEWSEYNRDTGRIVGVFTLDSAAMMLEEDTLSVVREAFAVE